jgi:hypothetical protein
VLKRDAKIGRGGEDSAKKHASLAPSLTVLLFSNSFTLHALLTLPSRLQVHGLFARPRGAALRLRRLYDLVPRPDQRCRSQICFHSESAHAKDEMSCYIAGVSRAARARSPLF